jgi:hypothetical protein
MIRRQTTKNTIELVWVIEYATQNVEAFTPFTKDLPTFTPENHTAGIELITYEGFLLASLKNTFYELNSSRPFAEDTVSALLPSLQALQVAFEDEVSSLESTRPFIVSAHWQAYVSKTLWRQAQLTYELLDAVLEKAPGPNRQVARILSETYQLFSEAAEKYEPDRYVYEDCRKLGAEENGKVVNDLADVVSQAVV